MRRFLKFAAAFLTSFAAVFCVTINADAYSAGINDMAGIYSESEIASLEARQKQVAEHTGWNIAVVTTDTGFGTDGYNAIEYAEAYYDELFGYDSSGLLYLIDVDYRHICISGDADYKYFNNARVNKMVNDCNDLYMDYDDVGNLNMFYHYIEKYYDDGPFTAMDSFNFPLAFIFGAIAAVIGVVVVISAYKFHYKPTANNYLDGRRINFYRRNDMYIREYTTRTRVSSSSGGGGRSHGSSGGHSHGGGGAGGRR